MGPDPRLQRAVITAMASRDGRAERVPWTLRRREARLASAPLGARGDALRALSAGMRAVPRLALDFSRRAVATYGWRR
jgi:hypothetical protein